VTLRTGAFLAFFVGISGCTGDGDLELFVDMKTDYVGGVEATAVRTVLRAIATDEPLRDVTADLATTDLTGGRRVAELSALSAGTYLVEVTLSGPGVDATRRIRVDLDGSRAITAVITRDCAAVSCPNEDASLTECLGGRCVSPRCSPEAPDSCPEPECVGDGECSTAIGCTDAICLEGACTARSVDDRCDIAEYCSPLEGCVTRPGVVPSDWFDPAWGRRKPLVIDSGYVFEDLTDFPILVRLSSDSELAASVQPDGRDLRFADDSGTPLPHELEKYESGTLIAWVTVRSLPATADTTIYVYYDNPSAIANERPADVWANGFTSVYHFGDGATLDVGDSLETNPGTNNGAVADLGWIHGSASFDGAGSNISAGATGISSGAGERNTVTFWMQYTGDIGDAVFAFSDGDLGYDLWLLRDGCFGFNTQQGEVLGTTMTGLRDRWVHVAAVFYNGVPTAGQNELYIDGEPQTLTECEAGSGAASRSAGPTIYWASRDGYQFQGFLDEGRLADVVRSPEWILAAAASQRAPGEFVTPGPEETPP
jgi:hypothetical protein